MKSDLLIIGGLSNPAKMPSSSWSIPAEYCKLGSKLRKLPGTTCSNCYACKGAYRFPGTVKAMARRYSILQEALSSKYASASFIAAFARVLNAKLENCNKRLANNLPIGNDCHFFRWHDSGDIQSVAHLALIVGIAERTPSVSHWLPTREVGMVKAYLAAGGRIPRNLTLRVSVTHVDRCPSSAHYTLAIHPQITLSAVHGKQQANGFACMAPEREGECGICRMCWSSNYVLVSYNLH
jgi:hypothetical protein